MYAIAKIISKQNKNQNKNDITSTNFKNLAIHYLSTTLSNKRNFFKFEVNFRDVRNC